MSKENNINTIAKSGYSIVIPCYNESKRIGPLMTGLQKFAKEWDNAVEFIFVNDGSTDDTKSLIESSDFYRKQSANGKAKLIHYAQNTGKGYALKQGVLNSSYEFILTMDADLACDPLELKRWLGKKKKFDSNTIYIGSRVLKESEITDRNERKFVGLMFNFLVQLLSPLNARDTQCGFKLYPAAIAKDLFSRMKIKGWAHDVEILYRASLEGVVIKEMPVKWRAVEGSKLSIAKDSLKMLWQLVLINFIMFFDYFLAEPVAAIRGKFKNTDAIFRLPFILVSLLLFIIMPIFSFQYGISGDERTQDEYGTQVYNYIIGTKVDSVWQIPNSDSVKYKIGGKTNVVIDSAGNGRIVQKSKGALYHDPTAIYSDKPEGIHFYGGLFDFLAVCFTKLFPRLDHYEARHLFNSFFGVFAIIFTGLLATKLLNWRAGLLALLLAALSPRIFGESMNNPKDIPYAMANICSLYFIFAFLSQLPKPSYRTVLFLIISIALAIGIRVGGLLMIVYLGLFTIVHIFTNKELKALYFSGPRRNLYNLLMYGVIIGILSYLGGLMAWPYGMANVFSNPLHALSVMSNYFVHIKILFKGQSIWNNKVPPMYIPTWIFITTPALILSGLLLFVISFFVFKKRPAFLTYFILLFTIVFPVFYVIYKNSELHDGMRHFYFVSLSIIVCAALGWILLMNSISRKGARWVVAGVIVLGLFVPFRFMYANHPNEYVYFNKLIGGIKGAYTNYETDYYMNSAKQAVKWLKENENLSKVNGKKVIVASNMINPVYHYLVKDTANISIIYCRWDDRDQKNWDYGLFYSRFIPKAELVNGVWPPEQTIHTISADGVPLTAIVKRTDKRDMEGLKALDRNQFDTAIILLKGYLKNYPQNDNMWLKLGLAYLKNNNAKDGIVALNHALDLNPENIEALYYIGNVYKSMGDESKAAYYLDLVEKLQQE